MYVQLEGIYEIKTAESTQDPHVSKQMFEHRHNYNTAYQSKNIFVYLHGSLRL